MSVKMRLSRGGTKKRPYYYVVIANSTESARRPVHRAGWYIQSYAGKRPRRAHEAECRPDQALAWRGRTADRSRDAPSGCCGPCKTYGVEQSREIQAQEEGARARGSGYGSSREGRGRGGKACGLSWLLPMGTLSAVVTLFDVSPNRMLTNSECPVWHVRLQRLQVVRWMS